MYVIGDRRGNGSPLMWQSANLGPVMREKCCCRNSTQLLSLVESGTVKKC